MRSFYDSINDGAATFWPPRGFPSCSQPPPPSLSSLPSLPAFLHSQQHYLTVIVRKHTVFLLLRSSFSLSLCLSFSIFFSPSLSTTTQRVVTDRGLSPLIFFSFWDNTCQWDIVHAVSVRDQLYTLYRRSTVNMYATDNRFVCNTRSLYSLTLSSFDEIIRRVALNTALIDRDAAVNPTATRRRAVCLRSRPIATPFAFSLVVIA